jgi:hypothetical protein
MSNATKSRFKVTLAVDSTTLLKLTSKLGLVGIFWSGQLKNNIQMIVLYAVIGDGKLLIPLDIRRPDPTGKGRKCKEQPELVLDMIRNLKTRCLAKGVDPNGWFIVMDSWYCSNDMLDKISESGFIVVIEGKTMCSIYRETL